MNHSENHEANAATISGPRTATASLPIFDNSNIWQDWFPESALRDVLAGHDVIPDIGQVKGAWKRQLKKEVKAGRLVTWKGKWYPVAGAPWGMGPDKTCYGTPELRDFFASARQ